MRSNPFEYLKGKVRHIAHGSQGTKDDIKSIIKSQNGKKTEYLLK